MVVALDSCIRFPKLTKSKSDIQWLFFAVKAEGRYMYIDCMSKKWKRLHCIKHVFLEKVTALRKNLHVPD